MKAIFFKEHGGADKLIYGDRPTPRPAPHEVLLRVKACALNHLDIWVRAGIPGLPIPLPHIPGSDVAGVVEKTGALVTTVSEGDKVMVAPGLSCGECDDCLLGQDHLCSTFDILGQTHDGGCAEYIAVPAANLIPIPDPLGFEEAASFPLVFLTAWHMLVTLAKIKPGETVLVHAAGSGVGIAAIQVAKLWGARVLTTVGTDAKAAKAKALGADEVINYAKKDFAKETRALTDKRGVDIVVEHIGQDTFEKSVLSLARNGRLVTCGSTSGRQIQFDLRTFFSRNLTIHGSRMGTRRGLDEAVRFLAAKRLRPVVDKVFPLKKAAEAHVYMEERKNFGKIVLSV
ncbi:MAG TPA: zinc-binding dehydrogenase [Elusimicrobiota bacterium]|nr:zinc-binding dehydrogenase [Elusimicrobiota bacterium]